MNAVIITGATSMLGIAAIYECIKNKVKVIALLRKDSSRKKRLPQSEFLSVIECDLSELSKIDIPPNKYDVFYHFGWCFTDRTTRDDPLLQNENIKYTLDAVQLAHKYGCKKFLGAGSQAEYGFHNEMITEETPVTPDTCYGYAKYAAGRLAEKLCNKLGIICIWTRIFSVYGKYDRANTMIPYAIRQYINNEIAQFSSGKQMWDFLFEEDAGRYFFLLGEKVQQSTIVNVASGDVRPLRNYIEDMANELNSRDINKMFRYEMASAENKLLNGISPNVNRLRGITGYTPRVGFSEGIRKILVYHEEGNVD